MDALKDVKNTLVVAHIQLDECADTLRYFELQEIYKLQSQIVELMTGIDKLTYKEAG